MSFKPMMCLYNVIAVAIVSVFIGLDPYPPAALSGNPTIFASLKISPNAARYCSVSLNFRALSLSSVLAGYNASPIFFNDYTIAVASCVIRAAAPSPSNTSACFSPSATLILDYR